MTSVHTVYTSCAALGIQGSLLTEGATAFFRAWWPLRGSGLLAIPLISVCSDRHASRLSLFCLYGERTGNPVPYSWPLQT